MVHRPQPAAATRRLITLRIRDVSGSIPSWRKKSAGAERQWERREAGRASRAQKRRPKKPPRTSGRPGTHVPEGGGGRPRHQPGTAVRDEAIRPRPRLYQPRRQLDHVTHERCRGLHREAPEWGCAPPVDGSFTTGTPEGRVAQKGPSGTDPGGPPFAGQRP